MRPAPAPIYRPYFHFDSIARVYSSFPGMLADGTYTAGMVMIAIASHMNEVLWVSRASYETFWNEVGIPRSTVKYTLHNLVEAGYLAHTRGTYVYAFGPLVQTFIPKDAEGKPTTGTAKKFGRGAAAPPPTSKYDNLLKHE